MLHQKHEHSEPTAVIIGELVQLEQMANDALIQSIKALMDQDEALARAVSLGDNQLNRLRYIIEERCYAMLEHVAPNDDPRAVVGMVNVATNLERIGDYAARIAHLTLELLRSKTTYTVPVSIPSMVEVAREMVEGAVEAYLADNDLLAERVVRRDRELVELYEQTSRDLMKNDPEKMAEVLPLSWVAINLERVGERAISICERAIYVTTGELKEFR